MAKICKRARVGDVLEFIFEDSKHTTVKFEPKKCPPDVQESMMFHGGSQKVGDSFASSQTVTHAIARAEATIAALYEGKWAVKREADDTDVLDAIARINDTTIEAVAAKWKDKDAKEKSAVRNHPRVKQMIAKIMLERLEGVEMDDTDIIDSLI